MRPALVLAALLAGAPVPARAAYKLKNPLSQQPCQGDRCKLDGTVVRGDQPDPEAVKAFYMGILQDFKAHPEDYTLYNGKLQLAQVAVSLRVAALDAQQGEGAGDRKREIRDLVVTIDKATHGQTYITTKSFGVISADTPIGAAATQVQPEQQGGPPKPDQTMKAPGVAPARQGPAAAGQEPPPATLPPGAPPSVPDDAVVSQGSDGSWNVQSPDSAGALMAAAGAAEPETAPGAQRSGAMATGALSGKMTALAARMRSGAERLAAGALDGQGAGKGFGSAAGPRASALPPPTSAREAAPPKTAPDSGPSPSRDEAAVAAEVAAASLPASARAAAAYGPLPKVLVKQPDFFDPARGGIAPERFYQLKSDYRGQPSLRETEFKHVGLSAEQTDFERTESCDVVSGACNKHSRRSYKKGDPVPPRELDDIWKAVRAYLKPTPRQEAPTARTRIGSSGIWARLRSLFTGRREEAAAAGASEDGGGPAAGTAGTPAAAGGPAESEPADAPANRLSRAPARPAKRHSGLLVVLSLSMGAALASTPLLRRRGR